MIKPVKEIPQTLQEKQQSYRDMIRQDIQYAIEQGINKFEFDGDYNYKYLANYAREEAEKIWHKSTSIIRRQIRVKYRREHGRLYFSRWPNYIDKRKYIKITSRIGEDRIHVYCEIFPDLLKEYEKLVEEEAKQDLKRQKEYEAKKAKEQEDENANPNT